MIDFRFQPRFGEQEKNYVKSIKSLVFNLGLALAAPLVLSAGQTLTCDVAILGGGQIGRAHV